MKKHIIYLLAITGFLTSCYGDDKGTPADVEPKYVIEDSSDPVDHARYLIFKNTGIYVLYQYDEVDYKWDIASVSSNILVQQTDKTILARGLEYLDKVLMNYYPDAFKRQYFPYKILIAQEINNSTATAALTNRLSASGRSYLAIGRIAEGEIPSTADDLNVAKGVLHGELWGSIIYGNGLIKISDAFFSVSEEYYDQDLEYESNRDNPETLYNMGFWSYNELTAKSNYCTPDHVADINDFVERITSHTSAEMNALIGSYAALRQKYTTLIASVKDATGIDLQEIGDNKPNAL